MSLRFKSALPKRAPTPPPPPPRNAAQQRREPAGTVCFLRALEHAARAEPSSAGPPSQGVCCSRAGRPPPARAPGHVPPSLDLPRRHCPQRHHLDLLRRHCPSATRPARPPLQLLRGCLQWPSPLAARLHGGRASLPVCGGRGALAVPLGSSSFSCIICSTHCLASGLICAR